MRNDPRSDISTATQAKTFRKVEFIAYQTEEEVHSAIIEILVFIVFLTVCTILAINTQNIYGFHSNNAFKRLFTKHYFQNRFVWTLDRITNLETWWEYVNGHFIGKILPHLKYSENKNNVVNDPIGLHKKPHFWGVNILLQPPRLRQIRVKPIKCKKHLFLDLFPEDCYQEYSPSYQDDQPEFKGTKHVDTSHSDIAAVWGSVEYYTPGEYVLIIPYDSANLTIENLQEIKWVDRGTRLVLLTLETYNYNLGILNAISLLTEVLPTGSVVVAFDSASIPLETIWAVSKPGIILTACIFYIIATYYMGNELYEIYKYGIRSYFQIIWNYFDWGIIIMAYVSLIFSILHIFNVKRYLNDIETKNELASLDTIYLHNSLYIGAVALCTFQMWIRIFRFISFNETMLHFNMALKRCAPEIMGFALILCIFFVIFAIIGLLGFGNKHPDFLNFSYAFFFMFRLMMHDFDYEHFADVDPLWGPLYFMSYVVVVIFVLVNMFLAIISLNYTEVKQLPSEATSAIKTVYNNFKRRFINCFGDLRKKIAIRGRLSTLSVDESFRKSKLTFDEKDPLAEELEKDEALKEDEPISSEVSTVSSYKSIAFEENENFDESKSAAAEELINRLNQRLNDLDVGFRKLNEDLDKLIHKIEDQKKVVRPSDGS